ncbi:unnamed protein product, partial [Ixodes hexagonus]
RRGKTPKRKAPPKPTSPDSQDPVEVYCRIRPLYNPNDVPVVRLVDNKVVQLEPSETNVQSRNASKQYLYTFKCVFDPTATQQEVFEQVGFPLVYDLLHGRPGLLFTYGITSSGKTYTMTGKPQDGGMLPRCLDVVFNSIGDLQARKYVFKPDRLNGFDTQTIPEALLEHQQEIMPQTPKTPKLRRKDDGVVDWTTRVYETAKVDDLDPDMAYAVFVSYIEIYNNYVYDLLEDNPIDPIKPKQLQSKMLREDSKRCVYAFGVTEVEAKNADEAFEAWCRGQKRKRIAHTALNAESSRSHSVFNIRLVQAPLDADGCEVLQDKNAVTISQLSLVDLAGSERTDRTGSTGYRLREAGNINSSLMVLRTCIEILRENQTTGSNKMVPYRDTKLTHLFKNFFDGEGKVRMIVCVNPRPDDYDETFHVMKFAEMAQEVLIPRSVPTTPAAALNLRTGRRRINMGRADKFGGSLKDLVPQQEPQVPEPVLPNFLVMSSSDEEVMTRLVEHLTQTIALGSEMSSNLDRARDDIRRQLVQVEGENSVVKEENRVLKMDLKAREQQVILLEKKLSNAETAVQAMNLEIEGMVRQKKALENAIEEKRLQLNKGAMEKVQMRNWMEDRIAFEREKMKRAMDQLLADKQAELEAKMSVNHEKFRILRDMINSADWEVLTRPWGDGPMAQEGRATRSRGRNSGGTPGMSTTSSEPKLYPVLPTETLKRVGTPSVRRRRSKSYSGETWVDHKPAGSVQTATVMQPVMKKRRSVGKLAVRDVTKGASKYALTHQEQNVQGDMETQLYKGDVIPSVGGGAQVIFSDVETLKQLSPTSSRLRKRSSGQRGPVEDDDEDADTVEARCSVSIEGHPLPSVVK